MKNFHVLPGIYMDFRCAVSVAVAEEEVHSGFHSSEDFADDGEVVHVKRVNGDVARAACGDMVGREVVEDLDPD
jgi:hypothetical protein